MVYKYVNKLSNNSTLSFLRSAFFVLYSSYFVFAYKTFFRYINCPLRVLNF